MHALAGQGIFQNSQLIRKHGEWGQIRQHACAVRLRRSRPHRGREPDKVDHLLRREETHPQATHPTPPPRPRVQATPRENRLGTAAEFLARGARGSGQDEC